MVTKEQIKHSLDAKWRLSHVKTYSIIIGLMLVFMLFLAVFSGLQDGNFALSFEISGICAAIFLVMLLPLPLYDLYRYWEMFRSLGEYRIYTAVLDHPETSRFYRGAIYYTVELHTPDGFATKADTRPLFSSGAFAPFPLEDYNNKTVTVAYKENEDLLVVLGQQ